MSAKAAPTKPAINILVAEDDANDVLLLKRAFTKAQVPAALFFVSNGQEAISYLEGQSPFDDRTTYPFPSVLLLDLNMPGVGGLEVLQWLAARPDLSGLRVAIISSYLAPEACRQAAKLGVQWCVTKPLDPLQLLPVFGELQCPPDSPAA
ncbi:MAG TPA: response regulator [Verrucomicrobiae bacterium]|nr:response regulator [Verrucomicrobiae bacterium]